MKKVTMTSETLPTETLADIEAMLEKATSGPWRWDIANGCLLGRGDHGVGGNAARARSATLNLAACARSAILNLKSDRDEAEQALEAAEARVAVLEGELTEAKAQSEAECKELLEILSDAKRALPVDTLQAADVRRRIEAALATRVK